MVRREMRSVVVQAQRIEQHVVALAEASIKYVMQPEVDVQIVV